MIKRRQRLIAGLGTPQVIGTPEQVADYFLQLSKIGFDGTSVSFFDFDEGMEGLTRDIVPLMIQAGPRHEHRLAPTATSRSAALRI